MKKVDWTVPAAFAIILAALVGFWAIGRYLPKLGAKLADIYMLAGVALLIIAVLYALFEIDIIELIKKLVKKCGDRIKKKLRFRSGPKMKVLDGHDRKI